MKSEDFGQLTDEIKTVLAEHPSFTFAIIGHTPLTYDLLAFFRSIGAESRVGGIYAANLPSPALPLFKPTEQLARDRPGAVVIAADHEKEALLATAAKLLPPTTRVLFGGYGHFEFRDALFQEVVATGVLPSFANGYPHTLVHLYQVLQNAARLGLQGTVVEFGMFKGGTTLLLSRFIERLGAKWPVIGFDTFDGFPPPRSLLDLYHHPDCVFTDVNLVRQIMAGRDITVVAGDIVSTASTLLESDIVLAFVDTDNYSSAVAILDALQDRIVVGGAFVFDHVTGRNRHRYTIGERMAAQRLHADPRYFHLHDTGVFYRQR